MPQLSDTQPIHHTKTNGAAPAGIEMNGPNLPIVRRSRRRRRSWPAEISRWFMVASMFLIIAAPLLVLSIAAAVVWQARTDEARPVDAIVVLGAAQFNGRPSNVLEGRLDHALTLYERGFAPQIVVTGGRAPGDEFTEAQASRDYLVRQGIPTSAILMENEGRDTWRSLQGVDQVLAGSGVEQILLVSDGFHLLRAELMARELGYEVVSSPTTRSPIEPWSATELGHVVRETAGIVAFLPTMLG